MTIYLRPKLESLSTEELMALQADACAHIDSLAESDSTHAKCVGVLDLILDVLAKRLDSEVVLKELQRLHAL